MRNKMTVFGGVMPCSLVNGYQRVGGSLCGRHPFVLIANKQHLFNLMFIEPCTIVIVEESKTNLMSLAILFHFLQ